MKRRIAQLEQRRQALLAEIETQRQELAWQAERFHPTTQVASWARRSSSRSAANHPLAWLAGIASILLMLKPPRRLISWLPWLAGALSLLTRVARVVRLINELRGVRTSYR
ncbi:MAG TPA: hypothetical protein VN750_00340 [Steroidobacteraceae bacterium]|nr:hypothetical protein [Steroidobacteraceae bacterium]